MKRFVNSFAWAPIALAPILISPRTSQSAPDAAPLSLTEEVHTAGALEEASGSGAAVRDFSARCQLDHGAGGEGQVPGHAPQGKTV